MLSKSYLLVKKKLFRVHLSFYSFTHCHSIYLSIYYFFGYFLPFLYLKTIFFIYFLYIRYSSFSSMPIVFFFFFGIFDEKEVSYEIKSSTQNRSKDLSPYCHSPARRKLTHASSTQRRNQALMIYIYCYKRNLDGSFETPFFNPAPPEDITRQANYLVVASPDKANEDGMTVKTLCHLGQFDFENGRFHLLEKADELIDLSVPYHQIMEIRKNAN